jgi:endonuclease YncB( thermonuclease family)
MSTLREYPAEIVRVIDGDTVILRVDVGFRSRYEDSFRLMGCNAPEGKANESAQKLRELLQPGLAVTVKTAKPEKYGRWLADIATDDIPSISRWLIEHGFAAPYDGGKR